MKIINPVTQLEVFNHWYKVEGEVFLHRGDIVNPLAAYNDLVWNLAEIEDADIDKIYICSSDDWSDDGLCIPDFKVKTAIENYKRSDFSKGKYKDIKDKENIFVKDMDGLDNRLFLVADSLNGPFTLIEGCKRSIALGNLGKLTGLEVFLGISPAIRGYIWSRYAYS